MAPQIPPAQIVIEGDNSDVIAKIEEAKAAVASLAKRDPKVKLGADSKALQAKLFAVNKLLAAWGAKPVDKAVKLTTPKNLLAINRQLSAWGAIPTEKATKFTTPRNLLAINRNLAAWGAIPTEKATSLKWPARNFAAVNAALAAWGAIPIEKTIDLRTNAALASAEATAVLAATDKLLASIGGGGGGGAGAAAAAAAASGGDKGGLGSWLSAFLTPKFGGFGRVAGGLGTALTLSGLSVDHAIFSSVGILGSGAGALLGGTALAAAAAAVTAVGMGSNALVGSSTMADTKQIYAALTAIQTAQATYGKNSTQAKFAQQQYNVLLGSLGNTKGVAAEVGLANAAQALNTYWDKATSAARVAAVKLYTEFLGVARTYIPLISNQAKNGFQILSKDLAGKNGLLTWLNSSTGGQSIFKSLGNQYLKNLPTAISAFTNGFEVLAKTLAHIAPQTGHFLTTLNNFFTKLNTAAGQSKTNAVMQNLISDFHAWVAFIKVAIEDIYQLFHADKAHTGRSIIQQLTVFLTQLHNFEKSAAGQSKLGTLFSVHKSEIMAILNLLPPLAKAFAGFYMALAPSMVKGATVAINAIVKILDGLSFAVGKITSNKRLGDIVKFPALFAGSALAIGIVANKIPLLNKGLANLGNSIGKAIGSLATKAISSMALSLSSTFLGKIPGIKQVLGKLGGLGVGGSTVGTMNVKAGAVYVNGGTGGGVASTAEKVAAGAAGTGLTVADVAAAGAAIVGPAAVVGLMLSLLPRSKNLATAQSLYQQIPHWSFAPQQGAILGEIAKGWGHWGASGFSAQNLWKGLGNKGKVTAQFTQEVKDIELALAKASVKTGQALPKGLAQGIEATLGVSNKAAQKAMTEAIAAAKKAGKIKSPSLVMEQVGKDFDAGLVKGIAAALPSIHAAGVNIATTLAAAFKSQSHMLQVAFTQTVTVALQAAIAATVKTVIAQSQSQLAAAVKAGAH